jgi:hypothetical protein
MKYRYIYSDYQYFRILDETDTTYHVVDDVGDEYTEYKEDHDEEPFWLEIIPKGTTILHRVRNIIATIDNVDINDYEHMYHLQNVDFGVWVSPDVIEPIDY